MIESVRALWHFFRETAEAFLDVEEMVPLITCRKLNVVPGSTTGIGFHSRRDFSVMARNTVVKHNHRKCLKEQ